MIIEHRSKEEQEIYVNEEGFLVVHDPKTDNVWTLRPAVFIGKMKEKGFFNKIGNFNLSD